MQVFGSDSVYNPLKLNSLSVKRVFHLIVHPTILQNILVSHHVDVNKVSFSKVVIAKLNQVVLDEASLHSHARTSVHQDVRPEIKFVFGLAELNSLSQSVHHLLLLLNRFGALP